MVRTFSIGGVPRTYLGNGSICHLAQELKTFGIQHVLITGASSFRNSGHYRELKQQINEFHFSLDEYSIENEPTPKDIDLIVQECAGQEPSTVIAIGGGSVIDAGKAVSAMLPVNEPVKDYLEGVGNKKHPGVKVPFIAIPTTAGTGSEATKNAVISEIGQHGFKKSLRHDHFIPDIAILDPGLQVSCPPSVTASSGMDAITQLIEAYVSTRATVFTDSLVLGALELAFHGLPIVMGHPENLLARWNMAYAAFISGIVLANAGLGTVHGFASSIGGSFDIPHGVICGTLLAATTKMTIEQLEEEDPDSPFLEKYARLGRMITDQQLAQNKTACNALVEKLMEWTQDFDIPTLGNYSYTVEDMNLTIRKTGQKNNPCALSDDKLEKILRNRL